MVRITTGMVFDEERQKAYAERKILGYYSTKKEAMVALAEYNNNPISLDGELPVSTIWNRIKDEVKVSEERRKVYISTFDKYCTPIADMPIKDVRPVHLSRIFDNCEHGYACKSNIRSVLNAIFNYANENDIVNKNYMQFIKIDFEESAIQRELYTSEEISELWNHLDNVDNIFTLVLLYSGMRIKELREMEQVNVDIQNKTMKIVVAKNNQSKRIVPIHDKILPLITKQMNGNKYLFDISKNHYDYYVKHNLNHMPYDTKKTFASKAHVIGIDKLIIQKIIGHKPESILEKHYTEIKISEMLENINKIDY